MESSDLCFSPLHALAPRQLIIDSESVGLLVHQSKAFFPRRTSIRPAARAPVRQSDPLAPIHQRRLFPTSAWAALIPLQLSPIYLRGHFLPA